MTETMKDNCLAELDQGAVRRLTNPLANLELRKFVLNYYHCDKRTLDHKNFIDFDRIFARAINDFINTGKLIELWEDKLLDSLKKTITPVKVSKDNQIQSL